jgi:hypothetical protein
LAWLCFASLTHGLSHRLTSFTHGYFGTGHWFAETRGRFETFADTFVGDFVLTGDFGSADASGLLSFSEVLRGSLQRFSRGELLGGGLFAHWFGGLAHWLASFSWFSRHWFAGFTHRFTCFAGHWLSCFTGHGLARFTRHGFACFTGHRRFALSELLGGFGDGIAGCLLIFGKLRDRFGQVAVAAELLFASSEISGGAIETLLNFRAGFGSPGGVRFTCFGLARHWLARFAGHWLAGFASHGFTRLGRRLLSSLGGLLQSSLSARIDLAGLLGEFASGLPFFSKTFGFFLAEFFQCFADLFTGFRQSFAGFLLSFGSRFGIAFVELLLGRLSFGGCFCCCLAGFLSSFGGGFAHVATSFLSRFVGERFGGFSLFAGGLLGHGVGLAGGLLGRFGGLHLSGGCRFGDGFAGLVAGRLGFGGIAAESFFRGCSGGLGGFLQGFGNFALGGLGGFGCFFGNVLLLTGRFEGRVGFALG